MWLRVIRMSVEGELRRALEARNLASVPYLRALQRGRDPASLPGYAEWREAQRQFQSFQRKGGSVVGWSALSERYVALAALHGAE